MGFNGRGRDAGPAIHTEVKSTRRNGLYLHELDVYFSAAYKVKQNFIIHVMH